MLKHLKPVAQTAQMKRLFNGTADNAHSLTRYTITVNSGGEVLGLSFAFATGNKVVVAGVEHATLQQHTSQESA
jgi:hypothetical protein